MFETVLGAGVMVATALLAAWCLAGYLAGRLAFSHTRGRMKLGAWILLAAVGLAGLLTVAELFVLWRLWSYGWLFVHDRVVLGLAPLLLPASAVMVLCVPRVWRISRGAIPASKTPVDAVGRSGASDPLLVVPVQATAVGAVLLVYLIWFPPGLPTPGIAVVLWGLFAASTAALWVRQQRRSLKLGRSGAPSSPWFGLRLLRGGFFALVLCAGFVAWFAYSTQSSALAERFSMMDHENVDYGGGPAVDHGAGGSPGTMRAAQAHEQGDADHAHHSNHAGQGSPMSLTKLRGPGDERPDRRFALTARKGEVRLGSGETVEAWTFNGRAPGPDLRVRQGDLVEVKLENEDIESGVTLHWHGIDVPNAEDGVAGLTQDAVRPGERHTYRFHADRAGTYWYHSHQVSSEQVAKGLFGSFVVQPREQDRREEREFTLLTHSWENEGDDIATLGSSDTLERRAVAPGTPVRLRLVNTDSYPVTFTLTGATFEVAAIDGTDLNAPEALTDTSLKLAAGGRYDVTFAMPAGRPVWLGTPQDEGFSNGGRNLGLLLTSNGGGAVPAPTNGPEFDPASYGEPGPTPFGAESDFDREFEVVLDNRMGFFDGTFNGLWTINGEVFPDTPMQMVSDGDLVKTTFVNRSFMDHPMHLHGHHILVLSRNGEPVSGSPWWADTLNVAPGETYEIAFRADNPGIWMDHCHNLDHAAVGMTMHLGYEGVSTPFEAGEATGNTPE